MARVGIFGAGWVGLVTGVCFAELGHDVVVRDVVPEKIEALRRGEVPFHEIDVPELLTRNRERLRFTLDADDLADCRFLFVCVDTPPTKSGDADLSRVWSVVDELPELDGRAILVMKSTVPVGTGEKIRHGLDERGLARRSATSRTPSSSPRARAVRDFMHPDRIAIGAFEEEDGDAVAGPLRDARGADRALRRQLGGDDQAGGERRADDADLVHQRDRERVRGDRRGRREGRRGGRATTSGSGRTSCRRGSATAVPASRRTRWR